MAAKFTISGLNHLALVVEDIEVAKRWFHLNLGLEIAEDRGELLILRAGQDLIAVKTRAHAIKKPEYETRNDSEVSQKSGWQVLDHYGFYAASESEVDEFAKRLPEWGASILKGPYSRSDGRSVYFQDPCGNVGEYFYLIPGY